MDKILSIIVPSYNMEAYLPKCLGSLIIDDNDLLQKLDVIVVNDGSKDRTSEIAHEFETKYPGVFRVIDKPNGHYGSCVNAALPVVTGIFVKILDADDTFDTVGLEHLMRFIEIADANVDVVFTLREYVNEDGFVIRTDMLDMPSRVSFSLDNIGYDAIASVWHHHITYRTQVFSKIKYHQLEGILYTDSQWVLCPMSVVRKAIYLPIVVYKYLCGREGQSVDFVMHVRNFSHTRRVTEQLMEDYAGLVASSTEGGAYYVRERLLVRIMHVYNYHLVKAPKELLREEPDLIAFDTKVYRIVPDLYRRSGTVRLLRRVPIGYVEAWRNKKVGHPFRHLLLWDICMPLVKLRTRFVRTIMKIICRSKGINDYQSI